MLIKLRGHLYEVTRCLSTRDTSILLRSKEAMQGVTKLMEERLDIIGGEEGGGISNGGWEVTDVIDDRLTTKKEALLDEVFHPCSTIFSRTAEVIRVEESKRGAILVKDFIHLHPICIDRYISARLEDQAVESICSEEDAILQHTIKDKVRLEVILIQVKLCLLQTLSIVIPVPSLEHEVLTLSLTSELR